MHDDFTQSTVNVLGFAPDDSEREGLFQSFFEDAPLGTSLTRLDGRMSVNRSFAAMLGYSVEELSALSFEDVTHPDDLPNSRECIASLLAGNRGVCVMEKRYIAKDGHCVWADVTTALHRDSMGQPQFFVTHIQDITQRRQTEAALADSEAHYRSLFNNMLNGFAYCRMIFRDGQPFDFVYLKVNPAFESLTGLTDVCGKSVSTIIPGFRDSDRSLLETYGRVARTGVPEHVELLVESLQMWFSISVYSPRQDHFVAVFDVITQRKQAEVALQQSERALKEAQRLARVGHWVWSTITGKTVWSDEYYRILEIPVGSIPPSYELFLSMVDPGDRPAVQDAVARVLAASSPVELEISFRMTTRSGEVRAISERIFAQMDLNGNVVGLHGTIQDITERVEAEKALRESESQLAEAQQIAHVGSWSFDYESGECDGSDEAFRIFGVEKTERVDLSAVLDRVHHDDRRGLDQMLAQWRGSGAFDAAFRIVRPGGVIRSLHTIGKEKIGMSGRITLVGTVQDVTEQKRSEESLREHAECLEEANRDLERQIVARIASEEAHHRLATVVEQAHESIVILNTAGIIEYVNPAFECTTGFHRDEAVGRPGRILGSGPRGEPLFDTVMKTISSGSVWTGRLTNKRKDGRSFEEEATIAPVRDKGGATVSFAAIKRDVTAEVALQEQLRHAQKIEAIGTLAGGVAHDFNNLLQGMLTLTQLMGSSKLDSSRRAECQFQLGQAIRRGAQLTRQLLLFARRERSAPEYLDLNDIVNDLARFLRRVVRENIELAIEPAREPLRIHADRGQIEQVIMNLTVNAIDAMPDGGTLRIRTGHDAETVWLSMADSGVGIPEAIRDRIFEPFFSTKEQGKGTGLGLSVVHGIVTGHGGRIAVESTFNRGTTFEVFLPIEHSEVDIATSSSNSGELPRASGERILLVEDEEGAREGLRAILEMLDYTVVAVRTGEEAVALEAEAPFAIVLTDFMLPGIPGLEVVQTLRSRCPSIKGILMSGYAAPGTIDDAVSSGYVSFLQKPFEMAVLANTLRRVLGSRSST